jgi:hypothetical protein
MAAHDSDGGTLEQRLRAIEDRLEIYNLIATHPPSADTGAGVAVWWRIINAVDQLTNTTLPGPVH